MNIVSIFGAGMLVGAAIIVVIPEAIKVIIEANQDLKTIDEHADIVDHSEGFNIGTAIMLGFTMMLLIDETFKILQINVASDAEEQAKKQREND